MHNTRRRKNNNFTQLIIAIVLIVLAVVAIFIAVKSLKDDSVPAISDSTSANTTAKPILPPATDGPTSDTTSDQTTGNAPSVDVTPSPFVNPLTGLPISEELSKQRPVSIMINNIKQALPQESVSKADVLYECLAEGGITRLLMLVQDYASLGQVGSVRSTRDYYLDFAQNHDALFFHAGGSEKAYSEIASRSIDNFDGVRMNIPNSFFRDPWRLNNMQYEHTLVITGEGIVNAIKYRNKRTALTNAFDNPLDFSLNEYAPAGNEAKCVYLPFSNYQTPYMKYNAATGTYQRWQYDIPHTDKTGEQLEFKNVIVLFCHHTGPLDTAGRIEVTTTGNGDGYYITNGKYVPIKYTKATEDSQIKLYNADSTPLLINKGKTYIAVFNQSNKSNIDFNYNK